MLTRTRDVFAKYTDEGTFAKIRPFGTVSEMWRHCVAEYGGAAAIVDEGASCTYAELEDAVAKRRGALAAAGVRRGDRVALLLVNSRDFVEGYLAVVTLGATAVILPAHLDEMSVFGCTMMFGAKTLLCHAATAEKTRVAAAKGVSVLSLPEAAGDPLPAADCEKTDGCCVMFTGGTTGKSKGALLSNGAVMEGTVNGCYGYRDVFGQRYLLVLPLSHVFGLIRNLMTSLYTGSTLCICRNNKDMFRDIAVFRPTAMVMVPALAEMSLNLSRKFGRNMLGDDMKTIICGAAAVAPYLIAEYAKIGINLLAGYGLTESANLVSGNPESLAKPESVGLMYPNQEYRVENGELWLRGANMMDGYVGAAAEENAAAYEDGWFRTGDLVRFDEDGFLYITGRVKEIIVLPTGENISPAEVEARFNVLSLIQDCQVFEDLNESGAHILALEVVPRAAELARVQAENPGAHLVSELEKINASLPAFQRVSRITVRDSDFERTPSMKIKRYHKV